MDAKKSLGGLDRFKIVAAFLVVAIHTSPVEMFSGNADFFVTRIFARIAVPFFLMVTGYFLLPVPVYNKTSGLKPVGKFVKKTSLLYLLAIVLYLPVGIYAGHYTNLNLGSALRMIIFDGTFYHLWYLPASILGVLLVVLLSRKLSLRKVFIITAGLYLLGLFGDSYFGLISGVPIISDLYEAGFHVFSYTRNGLFFAPAFLVLGTRLGHRKIPLKPAVSLIGFLVSLSLMTVEGVLLHHFNLQRHDSMYLFLLPCLFFLFQWVLSWNALPSRRLRTISTWIYIFHPLVIVLVRGVAKPIGLTGLLVENSLVHYLTVCALSLLLAVAVSAIPWPGRKKHFLQGRAWIELDRNALQQNVRMLRNRLPDGCELMPAVKAEAYGHGMVLTARALNRMGVKAFCVASVAEGVALRKKGVWGNILVLGYTHPGQFGLLRWYRLTQTVIDYSYAQILNQYGKKLRVHVGVDTGMHRLGERCENEQALVEIFRMKNLKIDGLFTHLSADDSTAPAEREFTETQALSFYKVVRILRKRGIPCPKTHLQASYGVLNYPQFSGDYARVGIALYGVLSTKADTAHASLPLQPVLSVKARVATVKNLYAGESAGYGLKAVAKENMKIAVIAIGYADGLSRVLSNGVGSVLIHGREAPIIGSICMDQTLIDVSHIPNVSAGDIAVVIGRSGKKTITACDLAEQAGTITNEILSRLGSRLERQMV